MFSERSIFLTQLTEYNVRLQQQQVSSSLFSKKLIKILDSAEIFTLSSVFSPFTFPSQVVKEVNIRHFNPPKSFMKVLNFSHGSCRTS